MFALTVAVVDRDDLQLEGPMRLRSRRLSSPVPAWLRPAAAVAPTQDRILLSYAMPQRCSMWDTATAARVCHRSSFHRVFELPQIGVRLDVTQPNNHYSGRRNSAGGRAVAPPAHAIACDHLRDTRGQLRVSALTRVPDALFRSNPYLMHLKDKATPQDNREGDLSPAELELLRSWDSFLELCGEPNGLSETELKALFVSFVARGGKVDDPSSPEALAVMTDVPPPSGTAYGPAPPTPKMKLSAREKVEFVEDLVQCHSARGHSAQSPRRDVKDTRTQNEALRHLTQQETARCQQQQINTLRAQERRLRFTANLYRRHNVKLTQPLLERRTIAEEEFTQQGTVASCGLRSSA